MKRPEQVILIDAKNYAHRMHWSHSQLRSDSGFPTSVLFGCLNGMTSLARHFPDTSMVWIWDGDGETWRHRLTAGVYKSNRFGGQGYQASPKEKATRADLYRQLPRLKDFLKNTGFRSYEVDGLEGDDLMGIMVTEILNRDLFSKVIICSADRDFYQFIGPRVKVLKGVQGGSPEWAHREDIEKEFGIKINQWLQFRAITGDTSDNIPHLFAGVGPKTAAQWILDGVDPSRKDVADGLPGPYRRAVKVRGRIYDLRAAWDKAHLNFQLCQIIRSCDHQHLDVSVRRRLQEIVDRLRIRSFMRKESKLNDDGWQYMTRFLAKYSMVDLMGRRKELWRLP